MNPSLPLYKPMSFEEWQARNQDIKDEEIECPRCEGKGCVTCPHCGSVDAECDACSGTGKTTDMYEKYLIQRAADIKIASKLQQTTEAQP